MDSGGTWSEQEFSPQRFRITVTPGLYYDSINHSLTNDAGVQIKISAMVSQLILLLGKVYPGICNRREILRQIWSDCLVSPKAFSNLIDRGREALEPLGFAIQCESKDSYGLVKLPAAARVGFDTDFSRES